MEMKISEILQKAVRNQNEQIPFVMATIVEAETASPGRTGFRLIVYKNGNYEGNVGGGKLEHLIIEKSLEIHQSKQNLLTSYKLTDKKDGIGMHCGGEATVFFEHFPAGKTAYIFGAGHLGRSLTPLLNSIDFKTVVVDNRKEFANIKNIPEADIIKNKEYMHFLKTFKPKRNDAIIVFTHGHEYDFEIINYICKHKLRAKYIGLIGSRHKIQETKQKIINENYPGSLINDIYAPIGLNIGKTTPQEIAIAIAAEILVVYNDVEKIESLSKKR